VGEMGICDLECFFFGRAGSRLDFACLNNSKLGSEGYQVHMRATHKVSHERVWSSEEGGTGLIWIFRNECFCVGIEAPIFPFPSDLTVKSKR
jgi:hypothetical protein